MRLRAYPALVDAAQVQHQRTESPPPRSRRGGNYLVDETFTGGQGAQVLRDRLKAGTTEQHPARLVWRFHAVLFGRIPSLLFKSTDTVLTGIAVFIALAAFINPWLAKQIGSWLQETNGWQGVSRWWGLLPIVALVAWELMKANFEKYEAVRLEHASMRSALSKEWGGVAKSVGDFITSSKLSSKAPINPADQLEIAQAELDRVKALFF